MAWSRMLPLVENSSRRSLWCRSGGSSLLQRKCDAHCTSPKQTQVSQLHLGPNLAMVLNLQMQFLATQSDSPTATSGRLCKASVTLWSGYLARRPDSRRIMVSMSSAEMGCCIVKGAGGTLYATTTCLEFPVFFRIYFCQHYYVRCSDDKIPE